MSDKNVVPDDEKGGVAFWVMILIIAFLFVVCIVCPLAIPGYSKQPYALPLMTTGLLLPFAHFFIFGGMELARRKSDKK